MNLNLNKKNSRKYKKAVMKRINSEDYDIDDSLLEEHKGRFRLSYF